MGTYERNMIRKILGGSNTDGYYRLKITGSSEGTNWMNITRVQLQKISMILND